MDLGYLCAFALIMAFIPSEVSGFCDRLNCPDLCELTYRDGCPHNCNCNGTRDNCPTLYCKFAAPTCIKRINHEGCHECVCYERVTDPALSLPSVNANKKSYPDQSGSGTSNAGSSASLSSSRTSSEFRSSSSSSSFSRNGPVAPRPRPAPSPRISSGSSNNWKPSKTLTSDECDQARRDSAASGLAVPMALINANRAGASAAFPPIFQVTNVDASCTDYRNALKKVDGKTVRLCRGQDEMIDEVFANFEVACGSGTSYLFKRYISCLAGLKGNPTIRSCEASASNSCSGYNVLAKCIAATVSDACKKDSWELHWQILSRYAKQFDDSCRLERVLTRK